MKTIACCLSSPSTIYNSIFESGNSSIHLCSLSSWFKKAVFWLRWDLPLDTITFSLQRLIFIHIYFNLTTGPDIRWCFGERSFYINSLQETSETRDEMNVGSPMFLKHSDGARTLSQGFGHFLIMITAWMPKMCIHILWNSTVFLCTPSFSVFPLWFLQLPHSAV